MSRSFMPLLTVLEESPTPPPENLQKMFEENPSRPNPTDPCARQGERTLETQAVEDDNLTGVCPPRPSPSHALSTQPGVTQEVPAASQKDTAEVTPITLDDTSNVEERHPRTKPPEGDTRGAQSRLGKDKEDRAGKALSRMGSESALTRPPTV